MRPSYSTITPSVVHSFARSVLDRTLGFQAHKQSVSRHQLLSLLLLVAATTKTLFAIARRYFDFSHETARQAVYANLTTHAVLTERLVDALHAVAAFSRRDRRRLWTVAIDLHYVPYYGSKKTPGILGGPKKQGTQFFHCYATAVLIHRRRRYTVGLLNAQKGLKLKFPTRWSGPCSNRCVPGGCASAVWFWMRDLTAARRSSCCRSRN